MKRIFMTAALAACAPDVPAEPTWTEDVMPIMRANCVRCHSDNTSGAAPTTFRLDRYDTQQDPWGFNILGAYGMRSRIAERIKNPDGLLKPMPPNGPELSDRQKEILVKWGEGPGTLGPPNTPPEIELGEPLQANVDEELIIRTLVSDRDGDYVNGELWYKLGTDSVLISRNLRSGLATHRWDTAAVAPGTYEVFAILFDDSQPDGTPAHDVGRVLGMVTVAHGGGTIAPRLSYESYDEEELPDVCGRRVSSAPTRDQLLHPDRPAYNSASVLAYDLDGTEPELTFTLVRGDARRALPGPVTFNGCEASIPVVLDGIPDGTTWRIEVEATDGTATRTTTSPYFIVSHATTTLRYASNIQPLLFDPVDPCRSRCPACHLETCAGFFVPDIHVDGPGIDPWVGKIYRKVVEREEMPPESAFSSPGWLSDTEEVQWITDQERATIGEWILGGAPQ